MKLLLAHNFGPYSVGQLFDTRQGDATTIASLQREGAILFALPDPTLQETIDISAKLKKRGVDSATITSIILARCSTYGDTGGYFVGKLPSVLIGNGQSNEVADPPGTLGFSETSTQLGPDILGFSFTEWRFVPLIDGGGNAKVSLGGGVFGPGGGQYLTRLARGIADLSAQEMKLITLGFTSQGSDYFDKLSTTPAFFNDGTQDPQGRNNFTLMADMIRASGIDPAQARYVRIQGEADANTSQADFYAKIKRWTDDVLALFPAMKFLFVATIGDAQQRGGNLSVAGVFAAYKQLADERPDQIICQDNRDFSLSTAHYIDPHYTAVGQKVSADRGLLLLQGKSSYSPVTPATSMKLVSTPTHVWYDRHSVIVGDTPAREQVAIQQDDVDTDSLTGGTKSPTQVRSSEAFGGRVSVLYNKANSESQIVSGFDAGTPYATFSVCWVAKLRSTVQSQTFWELRNAGFTQRIIMYACQQSAAAHFNYKGVDTILLAADLMPHSFAMTVNAGGLVARFYVDGRQQGNDIAIDGTFSVDPAVLTVGSVASVDTLDGEMPFVSLYRGIALTAAEVAAFHGGAKAEFETLP